MEFDLAAELERLANLGYAPNVVYDDDGNWAISDEGFYPVREGDRDFNCQLFGEAAWFRDTVRGAWECYLDRLRATGNDV